MAKEVADGRKRLPEQVISPPQSGVMGVGFVCAEANAPHRVKKGWLRKTAYYQYPKGGVLPPGLAKTWPTSLFPLKLPNDVVEATNTAADAFVQVGLRRAQVEV